MKVSSWFLLPSTVVVALLATTQGPAASGPLKIQPVAPIVAESPLFAQAQQLPPAIAGMVLQSHARSLNQPVNRFSISAATPRNWPDGCLGLAEPGEFCAQVLIPGWQVTVTNGQQNWTYRTDSTGSALRLEVGNTPTTPFPGNAQPGLPQPGLPQPGLSQPLPQPGLPQPGLSQPLPQPGLPQPGLSQPLPQPPVTSRPLPSMPGVQPLPGTQTPQQDWSVQLHWSRIEDAQEPGLVFQLNVLRKPLTQYANVVYQFYVRQSRGGRWEHLYTNYGARLIPNQAAAYTLPLELLRFEDLEETLGSSYKWDQSQIRVSVLVHYDLSREANGRDLKLRFQHEENYRDITALTYNDLIINADGSVELPGNPNAAPAPAPAAPASPIPVTPYPSINPAPNPAPSSYPGGLPFYPQGLPPLPDTLNVPAIPPLGVQ